MSTTGRGTKYQSAWAEKLNANLDAIDALFRVARPPFCAADERAINRQGVDL
jgi:hypothetical protein